MFLSNNLFSFSKGNKSASTNIKKIELIDKKYRTIAVVPFVNQTKKDEYSYIGKTIQRFMANNISILKKIEITTNDFLIPENMKTNQSLIMDYGTNFIRDVIILKSDFIYKKYIRFFKPDDLFLFSKEIDADYIISGSYSFKKKSTKKLNIKYSILNIIQNKIIYKNKIQVNIKKINQGIDQISSDIVNFFHPQEQGYLKIVTDISNYELFIDNIIIHKKTNIYILHPGKHEVKFQTLSFPTKISNFTIVKHQTNTISFYYTKFAQNKTVLKLNSEPTNANIFLNVNNLGRTPLSVTNLTPGKYRFKVTKTNFRTYFENVNLYKGTNYYNFVLERVHSPEYYEARHKKNKIIMYTTLGCGTLLMLNTYYFYMRSKLEYDKFDQSNKEKHLDKGNTYATISFISGLAGFTSLTISFIYFFKVIDYDDSNIGYYNPLPFNNQIDYAYKPQKHYLIWKYRF